MNSNTLKILMVTASCAVVLGGCKSSPERAADVERARVQVNALAQAPQAEQAASRDLANARNSLKRAETALDDRNESATHHFAYLATQQAKTGLARVGESRAKEQVAQAEAARARVLLESREREAEAAKEVAVEQSQLADARARQAESARDDAQQAQANAERSQADAARARQELEDLKAKRTERGMVLTLGDVLFDTAASAVKPGGMSVLDRVSVFLKDHDQVRVMVEGHTDSRGSDEFNQHLSEQRAESVAQALESHGVDADRVETIGRGESMPIAGNDTVAGQQLNRRVELVFSDASGQFASRTAAR
ncbi:MAG: OmpA family protein [Gammaproteobacteria bacterium]